MQYTLLKQTKLTADLPECHRFVPVSTVTSACVGGRQSVVRRSPVFLHNHVHQSDRKKKNARTHGLSDPISDSGRSGSVTRSRTRDFGQDQLTLKRVTGCQAATVAQHSHTASSLSVLLSYCWSGRDPLLLSQDGRGAVSVLLPCSCLSPCPRHCPHTKICRTNAMKTVSSKN